MQVYNDEFYSNELYHHGVKGMKWGVRNKRSVGSMVRGFSNRYNSAQAAKLLRENAQDNDAFAYNNQRSSVRNKRKADKYSQKRDKYNAKYEKHNRKKYLKKIEKYDQKVTKHLSKAAKDEQAGKDFLKKSQQLNKLANDIDFGKAKIGQDFLYKTKFKVSDLGYIDISSSVVDRNGNVIAEKQNAYF